MAFRDEAGVRDLGVGCHTEETGSPGFYHPASFVRHSRPMEHPLSGVRLTSALLSVRQLVTAAERKLADRRREYGRPV